jgi:hypothetical protein
MGNPLLDMLVLAKEDLLQKYGLDANNACLAEDKHQPLYQELVDKYEVEYIAGGAVQNSLRVTQVLPCLSHLYSSSLKQLFSVASSVSSCGCLFWMRWQ